jgi:hypothetical protein
MKTSFIARAAIMGAVIIMLMPSEKAAAIPAFAASTRSVARWPLSRSPDAETFGDEYAGADPDDRISVTPYFVQTETTDSPCSGTAACNKN